jgi:myo-inositol-1(or 4)-monophosphatase
MTLPSAASDLPLLEAAAREAGAIARASFGKPVQTWSKGAAGPVTEIDLAIDKLLTERLRGARPDYGWLSEEAPDNPERLSRSHVFMLDPIDGTQAFIDGVPQFTISIGVAENGEAASGVIYNPITEEMYLGAIGAGATLNGAPIQASARDTLEGAAIIGQKRMFKDTRWSAPWPMMEFSSRHSIAYRLALVAKGAFDATILFGFKHEWDIAAGAAIIEAAGGRFTDPWGHAIAFNLPTPRAPGAVASGAALHPLLIERTSTLPDPREAARTEETAS